MDSAVERGCIGPLKLPEKELTQYEVERYWTTDRLSLRECKLRHENLREFYNQLRTEFNNGER